MVRLTAHRTSMCLRALDARDRLAGRGGRPHGLSFPDVVLARA